MLKDPSTHHGDVGAAGPLRHDIRLFPLSPEEIRALRMPKTAPLTKHATEAETGATQNMVE